MSATFIPTPARFLQTAAIAPDSPAYFTRGTKSWQPTTWAQCRTQVHRAAAGLIALGVKPRDKIAILAYNRPEWVSLDLAAMMIGAIPIGIYFTAAPSEIAFIIQNAAAVFLAVENQSQYQKIAGIQRQLPTLQRILVIDGPATTPWQIDWPTFIAASPSEQQIHSLLNAITPNDIGTLIYTSGTTGAPKAVVLTHGALSKCIHALSQTIPQGPQDRIISYLPLAHIAERMLTVHSFSAFGAKLYFATSIQDLAKHLPEVRPTILFGVPRVWEKLASAVRQKLAAATGPKARLINWAQSTASAWHQAEREGRRPNAALNIQKRTAERLVYSKIKSAIGLNSARMLFSGAAPIAPEVLEFLASLNIVVFELYGQSETCGPTATNLPGHNRLGSVGRPIPGTELKIAPDGEVMVRDAKLFSGYAGSPEATAETLIDGWLHSGDLGRLDTDGYLYITGRKKDLIITAGGKNISPAPIEAALEAAPIIEHAVLAGDRKPFIAALVTLNPEHLATLTKTLNLPPQNLHSHPLIRAEVQRAIDAVNAEQSRVAAIRKYQILPTGFTVETGELTPTLKTKRATILQRHAQTLESLYDRELA